MIPKFEHLKKLFGVALCASAVVACAYGIYFAHASGRTAFVVMLGILAILNAINTVTNFQKWRYLSYMKKGAK